MSFMGFVNYLMNWYCLKNYFELVFYIIFLTFVVFVIEMMLCVNIVEITKAILRKIIVKPKEEHLFYTKGRGCDAKGFYHANGFTVLKGSIISPSSVPSFSWKEKRQNLLKDYTISKGDILLLESDKTFPSPSTAADFCIGSSNNGWIVWKDDEGHTLDSVYRKQLE